MNTYRLNRAERAWLAVGLGIIAALATLIWLLDLEDPAAPDCPTATTEPVTVRCVEEP
jgi:hypothetical protein